MITIFNKIVNNAVKDFLRGKEPLAEWIKAYNHYQENECDGVGYLFNIEDKEDVKVCLEGGMTPKEFYALYTEYKKGKTPFFLFGVNHPKAELLASYQEIRQLIAENIGGILDVVIDFPYVKEYECIYTAYIARAIRNDK